MREVAKDKKTYSDFSKTLGKVTQDAAQKAYQQVSQRPDFLGRSGRIPIRPVILGGDDLTRGYALGFKNRSQFVVFERAF